MKYFLNSYKIQLFHLTHLNFLHTFTHYFGTGIETK
jgi:hypothetical protein